MQVHRQTTQANVRGVHISALHGLQHGQHLWGGPAPTLRGLGVAATCVMALDEATNIGDYYRYTLEHKDEMHGMPAPWSLRPGCDSSRRRT